MLAFFPPRVFRASILFLLLAGLGGCEQGARRLSLDKSVARESFVTFLESWKKGDQPTALKQGSPQIIVGDADWNSGRRLVAYRLLETENDDGTNLHTTAEIVLDDAQGRERKQQITYVVGTSPVITIFRK